MTLGAIDAAADARAAVDESGSGLGPLLRHLDGFPEPVAVVAGSGAAEAAVIRHRNPAFAGALRGRDGRPVDRPADRPADCPADRAAAPTLADLAAPDAGPVVACLLEAAERDGAALRIVPTKGADGRVLPMTWRMTRVGRTPAGDPLLTLALGPPAGADPAPRIERELRAARQRADAADRAKARVLASASHDLRQPLQAALLFHAALARETAGAEDRRLVDKIGEALSALQEMMAAMLDVSRLDAETLRPARSRVPVGALLAGVAQAFVADAERAGIRLTVVPTGLVAETDAALVERILRNLVGNAVRHSGGRRIVIGARRRGAAVALQVWDDGRGVPGGEREAIFGEFYQLDHAGNGASRGMGLGLAVVARLARLLDGRAGVRSSPGRRTVFEVAIPRAGGPRSRRVATPAGAPVPAEAGRPRTVAVIDDEPSVVDALRDCLAHRGHRVVAATTIDALLDRLADGERPDAMVADYRLGGGLTGDIAINRVRERLGRPIPAVLLTGDLSMRGTDGTTGPSTHPVLHKPVHAAELLAFIEDERTQPA